jgi:hypothetical protein
MTVQELENTLLTLGCTDFEEEEFTYAVNAALRKLFNDCEIVKKGVIFAHGITPSSVREVVYHAAGEKNSYPLVGKAYSVKLCGGAPKVVVGTGTGSTTHLLSDGVTVLKGFISNNAGIISFCGDYDYTAYDICCYSELISSERNQIPDGSDYTIYDATEYIDDFLTQIIGAKPGETVMVEVTFPTPYGNPDLSGKDAVFETVINYIVGDTITPELTDAFVKENLQSSYGYTGVEDLKTKIKEQLCKDQMRTYLLETLRSQSEIREVPQKLIADQENFMLANLKNQAAYNNMTLNMLLSYYGWTTLDDAYMSQRESFEQYIQEYLVCQAVAETLDIRIDEETAREYFAEMSGGGNYDAYAAYYGKGYIGQDVLVSKVGTYLLDNAIFQ